MRDLKPSEINVELPVGFSLGEDADFVYLLREGKQVAVFSARGVDPRTIEKEAENALMQDV